MDVNAHDPHQKEAMKVTSPACPHCHQADQTRKVSAYFDGSLDPGAPLLDGSALAKLAPLPEQVPPVREDTPNAPFPRKVLVIVGILIALSIAVIGLIYLGSPDTTPAL